MAATDAPLGSATETANPKAAGVAGRSKANPAELRWNWSCVSASEIEVARKRLAAEGITLEHTLAFCWHVEDEGQVREAAALSIVGAEKAEADDDANIALDLRANATRILHALGDLRGSIDYGSKGLPGLRHASAALPKLRLLTALALAYAGLDRIDRAIECLRRARSLPLSRSPEAIYLLQCITGETLMLFGREVEAVAEYRKAYTALKRLPPEEAGPYRQVYSRVTLAQSLLMASIKEGRTPDQGEIKPLLDCADRQIADVPVLMASYLAVRGLAMAVTGTRDKDWLKAFLALPSDVILREEGWSQSAVCAWATLEAVRHGRLSAARSLLDKIDPADAVLEWPSWAAAWHQTYAEVHAAAGDHAAAIESYRAFAAVDRRARERHVALAFEMADRASRASEIRSLQRGAASRAERLAKRNAALAAEKAQLTATALTDSLTGLGNRRLLEERVLGLRARRRASTCTLVIGDVDHFKMINDRFSHQVGDKVLAVIGGILAGSVREQDCVVRWGGEEFVLLYRNPVANRRIDMIRRAVESWDWQSIAPGLAATISFGAARWTTSTDFTEALAAADGRLYEAKRTGRNRVVST